MRYEDLSAMVDFIYCGETNVFEGNLDFFLTFAEELQLKGLKGNAPDGDTLPEKQRSKLIKSNPQKMSIQNAQSPIKHELSTETDFKQEGTETAIVASTDHTTKLETLDEKVKAMMSFSEHTVPGKGRARLCNVCGKQGTWNQIRDHVEYNHITGLSIPCVLCGKSFKSRNALTVHRSRNHGRDG